MSRHGLFTLILLLCLLPTACRDPQPLPSQIFLQVDGRNVTLEQFQHDFQQVLPDDRTLPADELEALRRSYLAQRIDRELLLAEAARLALRISPQEIHQAMDSQLDRYPPGDFERSLANRGLSEDDWQRLLEEELLVEKVLERRVREQITISDAQIEAYFTQHRLSFARPEQVRARQISVTDEATGLKVLEQLRQGMPFAEAARRFSTSPDAEQGGDLGTFARGEMPEAFDGTVFDLPPGRVSDLVHSEYGYHIFLVEEHLPALQPTLDASRAAIRATLRRQAEEERYRLWLQTLREKAAIEVDWTLL